MSAPTKILVVDDDVDVRRAFRDALVRAGYGVVESPDGLDALERIWAEDPAVVVLDVEMPRLNGWKTLAELRRRGDQRPVLMITHVNDVDARVHGLEIGADDYIGKPCTASELVARVRALLRRSAVAAEKEKAVPASEAAGRLLHFGPVVVDLARKSATRGSVALRLTRTEFALLELLREYIGEPVSRETIVKRVWKGQAGASHALDTHLWRLRKKLGDTGTEPRWIRNLPGIGYLLVKDVVGGR